MMDRATAWWDGEWAAGWLRRAWGLGVPEAPGAAVTEQAAEGGGEQVPTAGTEADGDELDIAGWPALVAPFYD